MTAPAGPVIPGPMLGAELWRQVTTRAGDRCECTGGCGRKHKDGQGRCTRENSPWAPLHAAPADPTHDTAAAALPASALSALSALCDPCHAALSSIHAKARKAAHGALGASERLF